VGQAKIHDLVRVHYTGSLKVEIDRSLKSLSERQKETVCWFYGIGTDRAMSLEEIGVKLHLTTERIRQINDKAIYKIRTGGNLNLLRSFLGT
jgi:RNA polymerase primary sigma factor